MKVPLKISSRHFPLSPAIETHVLEKAKKLDDLYDGITSCRVAIESPQRRRHQGKLYNVRITLMVPGSEIVVNREPHEDLYAAVREAFDAARRQLEELVRRQRGEIKSHDGSPPARVSKIFQDAGYGFLETLDGREIYFHRNSVANGRFHRLRIGMPARYSEEDGDQGPQASAVWPS